MKADHRQEALVSSLWPSEYDRPLYLVETPNGMDFLCVDELPEDDHGPVFVFPPSETEARERRPRAQGQPGAVDGRPP